MAKSKHYEGQPGRFTDTGQPGIWHFQRYGEGKGFWTLVPKPMIRNESTAEFVAPTWISIVEKADNEKKDNESGRGGEKKG